MLRETLNQARRTGSQAAREGRERATRTVVEVITSDKVIQAVMTGAAVAVVSKAVETISVALSLGVAPILGARIPLPPLSLIGMVGVFYVAYWADQNTGRFREIVEEKTGEEASEE